MMINSFIHIYKASCHDTQHNGIQHNNTHHTTIKLGNSKLSIMTLDIQYYETQHNGIQHNSTTYNNKNGTFSVTNSA